jgi:hypothetical protein
VRNVMHFVLRWPLLAASLIFIGSLALIFACGLTAVAFGANEPLCAVAIAVVCIAAGMLVAKLLVGGVTRIDSGDVDIIRSMSYFLLVSLLMLFAAAVAT